MAGNRDTTKRVPNALTTETTVFRSYTRTDVGVMFLPAVLVILTGRMVLPPSTTVAGYSVQAVTLPLAGVALGVGAVIVALAPAHMDSLTWLGAIGSYLRSPTERGHAAASEVPQVERVHPDAGAIERTDGTVVAMVQVDPPNMALATDEEWAQKAGAFEEFLNTVVEFPIQLYATTRPFPVDEYLGHYEARLEDPDVTNNPQLAALIEEYVEWAEADLQQRHMTIRDHYVIVTVGPSEVEFEYGSLKGKLADLPWVGPVVRAVFAPAPAVRRAKLLETLATRITRVRRGLREIDGCNTRAVPATDATELLASFWEGEDVAYGRTDQVVTSPPIVGGASS